MPFDPKAPATGPMPVYKERGDQGYKKSCLLYTSDAADE